MRIVKITPASYGHYRVFIHYRKRLLFALTSNMGAIDRINNKEGLAPRMVYCGYTYRQAERALYEEVRRKNGL